MLASTFKIFHVINIKLSIAWRSVLPIQVDEKEKSKTTRRHIKHISARLIKSVMFSHKSLV